MSSIDRAVVDAAVRAAERSGRLVAETPLSAIAREAGMSRMSLYRRIGSRQALEQAVRQAGVDVGGRQDVRRRAVDAAADLVRGHGFGALTLEAVAARAGCSVPALHSQLGGREGIIAALFERHSPLPAIEEPGMLTVSDFPTAVRSVYAAIYGALTREPALARALLSEAVARPDGPTGRLVQGEYLPRVVAAIGGWLSDAVAAGACRPLPLLLLMQLLIGPVVFHGLTRDLVAGRSDLSAPPADQVVEVLAQAFLRAVAPEPAGGG